MAQLATAHTGPGCPFCNRPLPAESFATRNVRCGFCSRTFEAVRFEPPVRGVHLVDLGAAGPEGATPCGNHPGNAARTNCGRCGTFICGLCEIDSGGATLCPSCFERLTADGTIGTAGKFRDYGAMARATATAGCLLYFLAILIGPLAIYYGVRGLRQKRQMNETDGRVAIVVAMVVGAFETLAWLGFFIVLISEIGK